jgi:hypothetical protein
MGLTNRHFRDFPAVTPRSGTDMEMPIGLVVDLRRSDGPWRRAFAAMSMDRLP